MEKRDFTITAETGIHARPATILVQADPSLLQTLPCHTRARALT